MSAVRRALLAAVVTALAVVAGGVLVPPAAWAAPEYRISWNADTVSGVREGIARGDNLCDAVAVAGGLAVAPITVGTGAGIAAGIAAGAVGTLCGRNDPELRAAVDEAFYRKCGIDVYVTDGPLSYDLESRYVVCP